MGLIVIILVFAFISTALLASWLLGREQNARRRTALIERMRGDFPAQADVHKLRLAADSIPLLNKIRQKQQREKTKKAYVAELPQMLEIIALGVRSGLGFDQAFALYARRFDTPLAKVCCERLEIWERGLISREQGLKELASLINLPLFDRFVSTVLRALNYGAALNTLLLDLAAQTRKAYRAEQQEIVAKAPVKMLLPTGALILPAMLLLVIGPILLDLIERMN